jgi:hypothetical protein
MKINNFLPTLNRHFFFLVVYIALLVALLIPYYTNGCLVLGGEGNYVLDFTNHLKKFGFMWFSDYGLGAPNICPSGNGFNMLLLSLIEKISGSNQTANFVLVFSIYFLPFLAMFLVCKQFKATPFLSFCIAFLYTFNPFMFIYLETLNQWNVFSVAAIPLFFWVILRYYQNNFKLFFYFGFISLLFTFANTNYPMMAIIQILIPISLYIINHYLNDRFIFIEPFKKYCILMSSFIIFNAWWIVNIFMAVQQSQKIYSRSFAVDWLNTVANNSGQVMFKLFSLSFGFSDDPKYSFLSYWNDLPPIKIIMLVPFIILVYFIFIHNVAVRREALYKKIFLLLLILMFLAKGSSAPFGFIYNLLFRFVPFFYIFKSPIEKFGILYEFIFALLLLFVLMEIKHKKASRIVNILLIIYLFCCSIPLLSGNIFLDYSLNQLGFASRMYKDKTEYVQFRKIINDDAQEYRVLSLPGGNNYQVCLKNYNGKFYTGMDPVLTNVSKSYISLEHNIHVLYMDINSMEYKKLLGIYNIGKILINEDLFPWFGNTGPGDPGELKSILSKFMSFKELGPLTVFNNSDLFPRLYAVASMSKELQE